MNQLRMPDHKVNGWRLQFGNDHILVFHHFNLDICKGRLLIDLNIISFMFFCIGLCFFPMFFCLGAYIYLIIRKNSLRNLHNLNVS